MKILILILSVIFLSGCTFNLTNFVVPNDLEFITIVENLDTPKKIGDYMRKHFTYKYHAFYTPNPYQLFLEEVGDCNDMGVFGEFIANSHGYETWRIYVYYKNTFATHFITAYMEDKYSFTSNQYYRYGFDSFKEIVEVSSEHRNKEWKSYKVYDYNNNLIERKVND